MSTDREVTRIVRSWLEEGVTALPDRVLDAVLDQVPATHQRRAWVPAWRFAQMSAALRLFAAAAAVVVLAVIGFDVVSRNGTSGGPLATQPSVPASPAVPTPSQASASTIAASPSLAAPPSTSTDVSTWSSFTSVRDGYQVKVPPRWTATAATVPWAFASLAAGATSPGDTTGSPAVDQFVGPGEVGVVVSSQKIPAGMSQAQWFDAYLATATQGSDCFPPRSAWTPVTVDGKTGGLHGGLPDCGFTEVVVMNGGRAYVFTGYVNVQQLQSPPGIFDRSLLDAFLSTVRLHPTSADDRPAPSPSPS